ncbi:MAG TPA: ABC transporter permease [Kofleriaceae bacterium]|nr:ABC transporter permease [Kofleriaceae bacterium]
MNPFTTFKTAFRALFRNKLRSLLTVLGIVIGIAAVITMVAIGQGARQQMAQVFEAMGSNMLVVTSSSQNASGAKSGAGSSMSLTWDDVQAIREECPAVALAAISMSARVQLGAEDQNWNTQLTGTEPDFFAIRNWKVAEGAIFDEEASSSGAPEIVLGKTVVDNLFGEGANPVGQTMRVNGKPFEIVGVLVAKGQSPQGQDYDDAAFIPAHAFERKVQGGLGGRFRGQVYISAVDEDSTTKAADQIAGLLREHHHIDEGEDDDFNVRNLAEQAQSKKQATDTNTTLLAIVAAVSLVVGGIGVMNIMLVSVVERTREIGIRMAVGARPIDVLLQFLVESLALAAIGGGLGLLGGYGMAEYLSKHLDWPVLFPGSIAALAVAVSAGVGIVFGLYPAIKASQLDPITALRYEA